MSEQGPHDRPPEGIQSRSVPPAPKRNVRMDDALWNAAGDQGSSASEFVRESVAFRLGYLAAVEHGKDAREIEAMLRRILERGDPS